MRESMRHLSVWVCITSLNTILALWLEVSESAEQEVCCQVVFLRHVRSYGHRISAMCLPRHELSKEGRHNGHANTDAETHEHSTLHKDLHTTKES